MKIIRIVILAVVMGLVSMAAFAADPVIVDVRTEAEWNAGHIKGAVLIPYDKIEQGIVTAAPAKNTKIYLYCRTGRRTGIAEDALKKIGYVDLINLKTMENASQVLQRPIIK